MSIPSGWQITNIGELVDDFIGGGTPSTSKKEYWDGRIAWMTSAHIDGRLVSVGQRYITDKGLAESATHLIPKNNLLVSTRVGIGKAAINTIDIAISQDLTGLIIKKDKTTPDYLYWFLISQATKLKNMAQGSTIKGILKDDLARLKIPLPPLPEQQKIALILSTTDEAIQKSDAIIAKAGRLKQGMMQKLLTEGIGHKEFKETEIGRVPKEWEVAKVSDIYGVITGTTPSTKISEYWANATVNWFTPADMTDITGQAYLFESHRKITKKGVKDTILTVMPAGSLILSTRAPVGYVGILTRESTFNQGCKGLVPKKDRKISPEFYYYYFSMIQKKLQNMSSGSTFMELGKDTLERIQIPLPPLPEQQKIAEILSSIDQKIELEQKRKAKLERVKRGLMNDLLTGRKRVKVS